MIRRGVSSHGIAPVSEARWHLAQQGQCRAQARKRERLRGAEKELIDRCTHSSARVAAFLAAHGWRAETEHLVVEVGSGSHGLIWRWPSGRRHGVDPLAPYYRQAFAFLQEGPVESMQATGEALPFEDGSVYLLLSDNVLDHARDPARFLSECRRVLRPDGVLYLTVDVHHIVWHWGARLFNRLSDMGLALSVPAFPNHPFCFRERAIHALLRTTGFDLIWQQRDDRVARVSKPRDLIKRAFYKDRRLSLLARPAPTVASA